MDILGCSRGGQDGYSGLLKGWAGWIFGAAHSSMYTTKIQDLS